jgi:hypothetical protein
MGTTPIYGFPYPDPSDLVANYPALGQQLAEDVETEILAAIPKSITASVLTTQTTTSTSYADLATVGPTVTLTTGTKALVMYGAFMTNTSAGPNISASVAVSGATTLAASDDWRVFFDVSLATYGASLSRAVLFTTLTAGSNTFTMKYKTSSATAQFTNRFIVVVDMGS